MTLKEFIGARAGRRYRFARVHPPHREAQFPHVVPVTGVAPVGLYEKPLLTNDSATT
jgi:hypothetical protein